jgi:dipeptidyl aminopeptidase/acylaminoacyl peptidase
MRYFFLALSLFGVVATGCASVTTVAPRDLAGLSEASTYRFLFNSADGKAESFVTRPKGKGPFPLVVLLHGHSLVGVGARRLLPAADTFASELCYASLAISLPGYGDTQVPAGPTPEATRQVVQDAVAIAKGLPWVDPQRVYFYGFSRGAVVAAALINQTPGVKGALLHSGAYDLPRLYRDASSPWLRKMLNPNGEPEPKLQNLLNETDRWPGATLILHGAQDFLVPVVQANLLNERLQALGKPHRLVLYPNYGHWLPLQEIKSEVLQFLVENGGSACPANDP